MDANPVAQWCYHEHSAESEVNRMRQHLVVTLLAVLMLMATATNAAAAGTAPTPVPVEDNVLAMVNQARVANGYSYLDWDPILAAAAQEHADEAITAPWPRLFLDGVGPADRVAGQGYWEVYGWLNGYNSADAIADPEAVVSYVAGSAARECANPADRDSGLAITEMTRGGVGIARSSTMTLVIVYLAR